MLLDKSAFVEIQQEYASDVDKEKYTAHSGFAGPGGIRSSSVRVNIQPASPEMTVLYDGVVGNIFRAFAPITASGISEGMRLTVSGSQDKFIVRGVERYDYGVERHLEIALAKAE